MAEAIVQFKKTWTDSAGVEYEAGLTTRLPEDVAKAAVSADAATSIRTVIVKFLKDGTDNIRRVYPAGAVGRIPMEYASLCFKAKKPTMEPSDEAALAAYEKAQAEAAKKEAATESKKKVAAE